MEIRTMKDRNNKLLENWISNKYAVRDLGDGDWGWSKLGNNTIPDIIRTFLVGILWGHKIPSYMIPDIKEAGFDEEGFVITD